MLDFELAKQNGQPLTSLDEARLRNTQVRRARRMYISSVTLSAREPLLKHGWTGDKSADWRYAIRWRNRFWRWQENIGVRFLNKITGGTGDWTKGDGFRPRRGNWHNVVVERHGVRDILLECGRHTFIRFPVIMYLGVWVTYSALVALNSWPHVLWFHTGARPGNNHNMAAECLPDDNKLVARMTDCYPIRAGRGMQLVEGGKSYPLGTRYDWISGEPVLPNDPNYWWVDGRPIRKDRGYFNPGPKESMGKQAYEEDAFFGPDGKPRKEAMPYHPHH